MLRLSKVSSSIQGTQILRDVSLHLPKGKMIGLIGRNGAGKTTLIRTIMGVIPSLTGQILVDGRDMTNVGAHERAKAKVGFMPEDRRLIPALTVEENILIPAWANQIPEYNDRLAWVYELMPEVKSFSDRKALQLSGGQQKLVALARALMSGTQILLLDEPFEGVAPALSRRLLTVLQSLKAEGLSVMLSESDYTHSADLVDQVYIIERGEVREEKTS